MSESVNLPALGESVTEGTVTRWLKSVGDQVEVDEPLLEVSTDKVDTEIPSPIAGTIEEILVAEDETVEVGTPLVKIGDGSGAGGGEGAPAASESGTEGADGAPGGVESAAAADTDTAPAEGSAAEGAPSEGAPSDAAQPAPAETAPAEAAATAPEEGAPAEAAPAEAAPAAPAPAEVPSTDAPAPAESAPVDAPAPAEDVDPAPAAEASPAAPATADTVPEGSGSVTVPEVASAAPSATPSDTVPASTVDPSSTAASAYDTPGASAGYVTPLVRKLANEHGIDTSTLTGTGVGGRIRKEDVLAKAEEAKAAATAAPAETSQEVRTAGGGSSTAPAAGAAPVLETSALRGTKVPMSRLRKVVAERAVASMQASAQLTSVVEVDVTKIAAYRDAVKADFAEKAGVKLSFLPFFALAASRALKAFPVVNATVDGDTIVYPPHENLSIAVDTERGLLTPVIRDASELTIAQLAQQIADLAARTRDNKLKPDELAGGTFTLTNTGSRGALFDTPVVFLPQSAILGTGIVSKKPMVVSQGGVDAIAIRSTVYLALSYDHRIVDGADAARFLVAVKNHLESGEFAADLGV